MVDRLLCGIVVIVAKVVTLPGKVGAKVNVVILVRFCKAEADVAATVAFDPF